MGNQLTTNGDALRLFFTDDFYLIKGEEGIAGYEGFDVEEQLVKSDVVVETIADTAKNTYADAPEVPVLVQESAVVYQADPAISPVIPALNPLPNANPVKKEITFKFLGNNKRNILILVNDAENEVSDEKGRELLRKIVKSVNLTAGDFALLNYSGYTQVTFEQLQACFSSVLVFAFGVSPADLGMKPCAENSIVNDGTVRLIFSSELRKLDADPVSKKVLWASLQQLGL